ncbi:MAG: hypothetical protein E7562_01340 [Ruminococcaceae bacterium]|nr:hypothetical protein [Oscillospiraceae bacterium]
MKFWGKREEKGTQKKQRSIHISDLVASSIFQEILKDNQIPFICRQPGAGGYIKIVTGGLLTTDEIVVDESNYDAAMELYHAYFETETAEDDEE